MEITDEVVDKVADMFISGKLKLNVDVWYQKNTNEGCIGTAFYLAYNPEQYDDVYHVCTKIPSWLVSLGFDSNFENGLCYITCPIGNSNSGYKLGQLFRQKVLIKLATAAYGVNPNLEQV